MSDGVSQSPDATPESARVETAEAAQAAIEQTVRFSYAKLVAWLASRWRDVAAAEDALADALVAALRTWPQVGVPQRPEAWLLAAAQRRLLDVARHQRVRAQAAAELTTMFNRNPTESAEAPFPDERLALLFVCAHPAIGEEARAPLMLQTVLGLDAARIAAAWLVTPTAMSQRLVRAKAKIRDAGMRFQIPAKEELPARLTAVLEAIYVIYGVAYDEPPNDGPSTPPPRAPMAAASPAAPSAPRAEFGRAALGLARLVQGLLPAEPEAAGLLALLLHLEARRAARRGPGGEYVPLAEQATRLWDRRLQSEAEAWLRVAAQARHPGRMQLEAAIQSVHAARVETGKTDWATIALLYQGLLALAPSVGAYVGYAAALAQLAQAAEGLRVLDEVARAEGADVSRYQPYWAVRAHLLRLLGADAEAANALGRAQTLTADRAVREFLGRLPP